MGGIKWIGRWIDRWVGYQVDRWGFVQTSSAMQIARNNDYDMNNSL